MSGPIGQRRNERRGGSAGRRCVLVDGGRTRRGGTADAAIERSWAEEVGEERYATFRAVLDELGADHAPALLDRQAAVPSDRDLT